MQQLQHSIVEPCPKQYKPALRKNKQFIPQINRKLDITYFPLNTVSVEYEIEFMQEQRKVDGECDIPDKFTPRSVPRVDDFDVVDPSDLVTSTGGWEVQNKKRAKNKIKFEVIKQLQSDDVMTDEEVSTIQNVWRLEVRDRWRLYRKWVRDISQQHQNTIALVQDEYDKGMKELQELRNAESYELLREAHVIGMTTTGTDLLMAFLSYHIQVGLPFVFYF